MCVPRAVRADGRRTVLRKIAVTATALGALALPSAASAGVTLQPDAAPAGKFTRLDVRVPTERDVATKRVVLELPPGFAFASYQPVSGWRIRMTQRALAQPLVVDGQSFDREISRVTWTAEHAADRIPPGGFQDFGLAVRVPDGEPGEKLTFTATQTYADGSVVHFADAAGTATAAPQVTLNDALDPSEAAKRAAAPAPVATAADDGPSQGLVLAALAAGGLGLLLGFAGFVRSGAR
jgi:periplasmic copper chaperone A